jgi:beta-lactamase superfamily II metal-dependent hydrolase
VTYISDLGVKKLDYVIFTHPHEDHIGGAPAVLKAFDVGQIYMPRTSHTTQAYEDLLNAIDAKGLTVTEAKAGTVLIDQADLKAAFIGPVKMTYEDLNDWSAVLSLKYGSKTFLFEGDASTTAEADMLVTGTVPDARDPEAEIAKLRERGLIEKDHDPTASVTWGELATVVNRLQIPTNACSECVGFLSTPRTHCRKMLFTQG